MCGVVKKQDCVVVSHLVLHEKKVMCNAGATMSLTVRQHPVTDTMLWALAEPHPPIQVSALFPVSGHMFLQYLSVKSHLPQPLVVYRSLSSSDTFLLMFACFLSP